MRAMLALDKITGAKNVAKLLLKIAASDVSANRVAAIDRVVGYANNDNRDTIRKALEKLQYDQDKAVRSAVESALKSLRK
jgi:3-methyladenine DNA glycosylase AlkD